MIVWVIGLDNSKRFMIKLDFANNSNFKDINESIVTYVSDMMHLRRNRRVSVYPLTLNDLYHADIQKLLESESCEDVRIQMIRSSSDMKSWAG